MIRTHSIQRTIFVWILLLALPLAALAVKGDTEAARQGWLLLEQGALLVDVRSAEEFEAGHIEGAVNVPYEDIDEMARIIGDDVNQPVVLYCVSGRRAGIAMQALEEKGFTSVFNATGLEALNATQPEQ